MSEVELGEAGFWILTSLAAGRRHGYAILQDTQTTSAGSVTLKVTTLYAALERLEKFGWVAVDGEEVVDGRARRYFRLTDPGSERLAREAERLAERAQTARERLTARDRLATPGQAATRLALTGAFG